MLNNESPVNSEVETSDDEDFEALYESITNPEPSDGQFAESAPEQNAADPKTAAPAQDPSKPAAEPEYEYDWNGQKIKAPLSQLLKKAGMGHDYAQKMAEFNKQRSEFEQERSLSQKLKEQFGPVDEWVRNNPDKWEKLQAVIQAEKAGHGDLDVNHPLYQELQGLKKQLNESILPTIQTINEEKTRLKYEAEDKALAEEIQSIQEKYKDLDWKTLDEHGRSREWRVLKHAADNGFKTFKSAFFDLYHDDLEKRAEERGKGAIVAERQKQTKTGLLGKTQAPTQGLQKASNTRNKSYNDLTREALEELGIAQ